MDGLFPARAGNHSIIWKLEIEGVLPSISLSILDFFSTHWQIMHQWFIKLCSCLPLHDCLPFAHLLLLVCCRIHTDLYVSSCNYRNYCKVYFFRLCLVFQQCSFQICQSIFSGLLVAHLCLIFTWLVLLSVMKWHAAFSPPACFLRVRWLKGRVRQNIIHFFALSQFPSRLCLVSITLKYMATASSHCTAGSHCRGVEWNSSSAWDSGMAM